MIEGDGALRVGRGPVRTGVTVILPRGRDYDPVFAGWHVLNGCGEMTGAIWMEESGLLEGPVAITNTHSVGAVRDAIVAWLYERGQHDQGMVFAIPVVAETYDGWLNDINGFHVKTEHVFRALDEAASGPVAEGNVGGGTGMICHQFKGGIGTASRLVSAAGKEYTLGVLVQANYGRREHLTIAGAPVGREIADLMPETRPVDPRPGGGSIIGVAATDAPLLPHQLTASCPPPAPGAGPRRRPGPQLVGRHLPGLFHGQSRRGPARWPCRPYHALQRRDEPALRGRHPVDRGVHRQCAAGGGNHDRHQRQHGPRSTARPSHGRNAQVWTGMRPLSSS